MEHTLVDSGCTNIYLPVDEAIGQQNRSQERA